MNNQHMEKKKYQIIENHDYSNAICVFQKIFNVAYH